MATATDLLTTFEVAELLGKRPRTVQRLAADGEIPATKLPGPNGAYLFTRDAVDEYAARASDETQAAS